LHAVKQFFEHNFCMDIVMKYEDWIENLAKNKQSILYSNSGPEHATVVLSTMFKYAQTEVCIYAGAMNGGISNKTVYLDNVAKFLSGNGKLKMLLKDYSFENNQELFGLLRQFQFINPEQVQIRKAYTRLVNADGNEIHFTTADQGMYRLEKDIGKFHAIGSFNDTKTVKTLKDKFDSIFETSEPVFIN
jgi:hypothetical protein